MAEKDILEKILLSHADVFADCENALCFGGVRKLDAGEMQPAPTESFYQGRGRAHNQFCDISFFRMKNGEIKAQYIIENETEPKRRQVLRKASYQGGAYRAQLDLKNSVYPVVCMTLDWTRKRPFYPMSLKELLAQDGAGDDELHLADDVKLTVYHMNHLSREVRSRFSSDMGFVVDYLNEGSFEGREGQKIIHAEALCDMMQALTGDARFTDLVDELLKRQKEGKEIVMCEYIDMLEARGEERGKKIGEERGKKIGEERGKKIGENRLAQLIQLLLKEQKLDEVEQAVSDSESRNKLYQAYGV